MNFKTLSALPICIFLLSSCASPSVVSTSLSTAPTSTVIPVESSSAESAPSPPATAVAWSHPDGTTHWYEAIAIDAGVNWPSADQAAQEAGGYLATITSSEENEFVFGLVQSDQFWNQHPNGILVGPWLGGIQPFGSTEPDGSWRWVTGEPFSFVNWSPGEPNQLNGNNQNRIHFGEASGAKLPTWNDIPAGRSDVRGFVIEYNNGDRSQSQPESQPGNSSQSEAQAFPGYTLIAPIHATTTYLIDLQGTVAHTWESRYRPAQSAYLLESGNLLRTAFAEQNPTFAEGAAKGGLVQEFTWDGDLVWEFSYSSDQYLLHHDVEPMPNGNVLMIAWEYKSVQESIAAGRNPERLDDNELWPDHVIEVRPTGANSGEIVWEWHLWDHLIQDLDPSMANYGIVADHPELPDINFFQGRGGADWTHINGIAYNADLDQIVLSVHNFNEIWVIDHSTSSEEAAGHTGGASGSGGDILYRWGNPRAYAAGSQADQQLFGQHDGQWIADGLPGSGNIIIFNNGMGNPGGDYSSIVEITPPVDQQGHYAMTPGAAYAPSILTWTYSADPPTDFYSQNISGAQRLPNGNTLVCEGASGRLFEVTASGDVVWEYFNAIGGESGGPNRSDNRMENAVFKVRRYALDYAAISGRVLGEFD